MFIKNIENNEITVAIPLTKGKDKIRIKQRPILNEYGIPVSTRQEPFNTNCYVEWQIGYDVVVDDTDKLNNTTLQEIRFTGANGKEKALYELSEYIKYFYDWNIIKRYELEEIKTYLESLNDDDFLNNSVAHPELAIKRTAFVPRTINGFSFLWSQIDYPLLVYKFGDFEIITEIVIREQQFARGIQPMLYFCFPITQLEDSVDLIGRTANVKEMGEFKISQKNISVFLEILKLFGTLSSAHNKDVISIIDVII